MAIGDTQIVQATGDLHHQIRHTFFRQPQHLFNNPTAFDTRDHVFDHHPYTGDKTIQQPFTSTQFPARGLFLGCMVSVPDGS